MTPDTFRVTPVTPDLVGRVVLVEHTQGELVKARVTAVRDYVVSIIHCAAPHEDQRDVDLSDGRSIWVRVA